MKKMSFNLTENGLDGTLLRLCKSIAEVTRDILAVSDAPSDIGTAAARVTLAFDHHSLRTSVYHGCRARAREYVELSSSLSRHRSTEGKFSTLSVTTDVFSTTWITRVLNGLVWLFFMKEKPQMLSGSSNSYLVLNRRLLTQLNSSVVAVHGLEADLDWA